MPLIEIEASKRSMNRIACLLAGVAVIKENILLINWFQANPTFHAYLWWLPLYSPLGLIP